mmetsp:Transcript_10114/g.19827  ORF Transcript_10114/g.19827 Transcript_10114/m.19827 type:complete len:86 (+) Transcript_10114:27-284(+)
MSFNMGLGYCTNTALSEAAAVAVAVGIAASTTDVVRPGVPAHTWPNKAQTALYHMKKQRYYCHALKWGLWNTAGQENCTCVPNFG